MYFKINKVNVGLEIFVFFILVDLQSFWDIVAICSRGVSRNLGTKCVPPSEPATSFLACNLNYIKMGPADFLLSW